MALQEQGQQRRIFNWNNLENASAVGFVISVAGEEFINPLTISPFIFMGVDGIAAILFIAAHFASKKASKRNKPLKI